MSLENAINSLIEASSAQTARAEALNDTVSNKISNIDENFLLKSNELTQFILDTRKNLTGSLISSYDTEESFSKSSLEIVADAIDNTKSEWTLVTPSNIPATWFPSPEKLTYIRFKQAFSAPPGHYQTPPYLTDTSRTFMRFIVSNIEASQTQIKEQIAEHGFNPNKIGEWAANVSTSQIDCMEVPNVHPYMGLWVQFFNIGLGINGVGNGVPQEITSFGGDANFNVHSIENYPQLDD